MSLPIGYLLIFSYLVIIIIIFEFLFKHKIKSNVSRKLVHISMIGVLFVGEIYFMNSIHQFIIPLIFIFLIILLNKFNLFKKIITNEKDYFGILYFCLSIFVLMLISYFYKEYYSIANIAIIGLIIGDGFAGLIGDWIKSPAIYKNKTLAGFIACIFSSFLGIFLVNINLQVLSLPTIFVLSFVIGIIELIDYRLDNLAVPIIAFIVAILFKEYYSLNLLLASVYSIVLFLNVFLTKKITYYGSLLAMFYVGMTFYYGGYGALVFVVFSYIIIVITEWINGKKNRSNEIVEKSKNKDFFQIISSGALPIILLLLFKVFDNYIYIYMFYISIAGVVVDSVSSDIGMLSKEEPYDIIKRNKVSPGMSGGITRFGLFIAFIFSCILSLIVFLILKLSYLDIIFGAFLIYSTTIVDSILGSILQVKRICTVCLVHTEKVEHCNVNTEIIRGLNWLNNDFINFASGVIVSILTVVLLG